MQAKKVRDTLATIFVPYEGENKPMVFSYHYQYEQYLKDNNLIDPEKAKSMVEKNRRKQNLMKEKAAKEAKENKDKLKQPDKEGATTTVTTTANPVDGEDLSAMDEDNSHSGMMAGKHRFDQLIKTMIARIEYNNTLAPV